MHELSIALSIVDLAGEEARRRAVRVEAIHLKLGPLSGVVKEALLSAWELAREESPFPDARLIIRDVPIVVRCPVCRAETPAKSMQEICCSACGTPTPDIVSGRELEVVAMEVFDERANAPGGSPSESAEAE